MNRLYVLFSILYLSIQGFTLCMEKELTPPNSPKKSTRTISPLKKSVTYASNKDNIPKQVLDVLENPHYSNYTIRSLVISQPKIAQSIANIASPEKKGTVSTIVGPHHLNKISLLPSDTQIDKEEHRKTLVALRHSPSKKTDSPNKSAIISGSANYSNQIWPNGNDEAILVIIDHEKLALKTRSLLLSESPEKNPKKTVPVTPKKPAVFGSRAANLGKIIQNRVNNVAQKSDDNRFVWGRTMNINDNDLAKKYIKAAKSGADARLIVHKSSLTSAGIPLLKHMKKNGVAIYINYPAENKRTVMHVKDIITSTSYTNSTANFTHEGDIQQNITFIFPDNQELIAVAKKHFEQVQTKCISLTKALKLLKEKKAKEKEKKAKEKEEKKKSPSAKRNLQQAFDEAENNDHDNTKKHPSKKQKTNTTLTTK